jgi:hypothetical protein
VLPPHDIPVAQAYRLMRRALVGHAKANKALGPSTVKLSADKEFERLIETDGDGIHSLVIMQLADMFCTEGAFETANGDTMEVLMNLRSMIAGLKELKSNVAHKKKRGKHG